MVPGSPAYSILKLVTNLNNNEQETSEVQFEEYALKLNASDCACRSKQTHNKDEILPAPPQELHLLVKELGPMLNRKIFNLRLCLLNPCYVVAQWSHHSLIQKT